MRRGSLASPGKLAKVPKAVKIGREILGEKEEESSSSSATTSDIPPAALVPLSISIFIFASIYWRLATGRLLHISLWQQPSARNRGSRSPINAPLPSFQPTHLPENYSNISNVTSTAHPQLHLRTLGPPPGTCAPIGIIAAELAVVNVPPEEAIEMETIVIPSPSAFLSSPVIKPAPEPPPPPPKPKPKKSLNPSARTQKPKAGVVKPKQSKSRNGCITCKAKRLKCDETKPSCQQCHKRSVTCGGFKKDFKWRPFEETTFTNKTVPSKSKRNVIDLNKPPNLAPTVISPPTPKSDASSTPDGKVEVDNTSIDSFVDAAVPTTPDFPSLPQPELDPTSLSDVPASPNLRGSPGPPVEDESFAASLSHLLQDTDMDFSDSVPRPLFYGQFTKLIDLVLPGSELNGRPRMLSISPACMPTPAMTMSPVDNQPLPGIEDMHGSALDEGIEDIVREQQISISEMWTPLWAPTPYPFSPATLTPSPSPVMALHEPLFKLYMQPEIQAGSSEILMLRFDKQTCGILSVKDGPTENPWRTLIWPLARESPALYHAIASMTAFHTSKQMPALRVDGMEHMRKSIVALASGIEEMRTDTALATTLVLAFSESWDQHISTGIEHLRGARILVNRALVCLRENNLSGDDLARLRFLCNTWIYMDVIARLTSVDNDDSNGFDQATQLNLPAFPNTNEIDPLMGCASTLFPFIGRVANLCRKVRKVESNSIQIVSQAIELKESIEQWRPPPSTTFERPEDPTSEIQHALQTAEAYRYATLLYLHQAVPEIPSLTSAQLAKKVLVYLATVPLSSRLVIVQIYPLLAAGCEVYDAEDRQWVEDRWRNMAARMWIGNIDRCWEVMQEVWARRDAAAAAYVEKENRHRSSGASNIMRLEASKRMLEDDLELCGDSFSCSDMLDPTMLSRNESERHKSTLNRNFSGTWRRRLEPVTEEMDIEVTVRGRMHWVGVMKDWKWEVLLG
ncbi:Zn2 DNA-binding protein [Venustampulla echinocandica]|uniref:Zn2 DNA-binding protein n=1 Tax=Venustampulla echinocandica TaxID=2656787 RepID=A0A370TZB4_9HELO|nr:Zn2 DNA-binding protein [Venustampulla echinocandica]RDL40866.1 Zn2 DNA-binding protein [Venustampulla echinocandica]